MSEQREPASYADWDIADRMRRALRVSDTGVQEIAEYLGVARNTVSTWINGRITPSTQTVRLWALRTGVPYEWLLTGVTSGPGGDNGATTMLGQLPRLAAVTALRPELVAA